MLKKNRTNKVRVAVLAALAAQAGLISNVSLAQPALEEIVITSTRREVNVQDAPVSITAITGDSLEQQNIENVQDLTAVVPNLVIRGGNQGSNSASINMRGIPDVGTYVDGVWQVSNLGLLQRQFVDLERIEVLRGPQGTLYGRDSTGGAISVVTKKPNEEFGAVVEIGVGDFDRRDISASVDIPLTDTVLTRWTLGSYQKDGYVHSVVNGYDYGDMANDVFRGDISWTPTDDFSARVIYSEDDQVSTTARIQNFINPQVAYTSGYQIGFAEAYDIASQAQGGPGFNNLATVSGFPGGSIGEYENTATLTMPDRSHLEQLTVNLEYQLNNELSLKYIYGQTDLEAQRHTDYAGSIFNFFSEIDLDLLELTSHEIQLNGDYDRLRWNVGFYRWDQTNKQRIAEISMSDWTLSQIDANRRYLDYNDVLSSATCAMSPADHGLDFGGNPSDPATWPIPCDAFGGNGWVGLFAGGPDGRSPEEATQAEQEGTAWFGQLNYDITNEWDVTVGVRYHEQDNVNYNLDLAGAIAAGVSEVKPLLIDTPFASIGTALGNVGVDASTKSPLSFRNTSYRFATSYDIRDNVMAYFGYSEGFNSGGISSYVDSQGVVNLQFDPETIENMELGLRGDFFDNRLRANVTYFDTDWIDIQLQTEVFDRTTGVPLTTLPLQNAATGNANGIEFELTYAATDDLVLGANLGFLDTEYTGVPGSGAVTRDTEFGGAPERSYNLTADYTWNMSGGHMIAFRASANYFDNYWRSENPILRQEASGGTIQAGDIWLVNARATFTPASDDYELSFWVNNLTDSYNLNSGFMHGLWQFDFAGVDSPREMGLSLKMRF